MSLDIDLCGPPKKVKCYCLTCDDEHYREKRETFYEANVTHNLTTMADEAGIYKHVWRPEEIGITKAKQLIKPLKKAINDMKMNPDKFKKHNPKNGWGSYDSFIVWLENYLQACSGHPESDILISR